MNRQYIRENVKRVPHRTLNQRCLSLNLFGALLSEVLSKLAVLSLESSHIACLFLYIMPTSCVASRNVHVACQKYVFVSVMSLIPFTDWSHNAHSVLFEQSKNAHYVPILSRV